MSGAALKLFEIVNRFWMLIFWHANAIMMLYIIFFRKVGECLHMLCVFPPQREAQNDGG